MRRKKLQVWLYAGIAFLVTAIATGALVSSTTSARKIQVCELEAHKIVVIDYNDLSPAYSTRLDDCR